MRAAALAVALGLATVVAGPGAAPAAEAASTPTAGPATVSDAIVGFTFVVGWASLNAPDQMLRIHTGDTVEWTNFDPVAHDVSFDVIPKVLYLKKPV